MLSQTLSLEEGKGLGPPPPPPSRIIPSGPVLETFFQTLIVVLVLQQREVTVPRACRQENCWEPHIGQGGLAPPEDVVLAFLKCPRL